jgi:MFS family permease
MWRWLFLVNVPVGALALALAVLFIPEDNALIQRRTFDLPGFLILAPALVLFLYGADNIRDHSGQLCFAIAIVMIIVFSRGALRKGPEALLDLRLFRSGVFPVSARSFCKTESCMPRRCCFRYTSSKHTGAHPVKLVFCCCRWDWACWQVIRQ